MLIWGQPNHTHKLTGRESAPERTRHRVTNGPGDITPKRTTDNYIKGLTPNMVKVGHKNIIDPTPSSGPNINHITSYINHHRSIIIDRGQNHLIPKPKTMPISSKCTTAMQCRLI